MQRRADKTGKIALTTVRARKRCAIQETQRYNALGKTGTASRWPHERRKTTDTLYNAVERILLSSREAFGRRCQLQRDGRRDVQAKQGVTVNVDVSV